MFLLLIKGGDPSRFRLINDAYNKLIAHSDYSEKLEADAELKNSSVIIEISKQALPKWWEKLKNQYGTPKSSGLKNLLFQVKKCHLCIFFDLQTIKL